MEKRNKTSKYSQREFTNILFGVGIGFAGSTLLKEANALTLGSTTLLIVLLVLFNLIWNRLPKP